MNEVAVEVVLSPVGQEKVKQERSLKTRAEQDKHLLQTVLDHNANWISIHLSYKYSDNLDLR
tara:strand:- start:490 stop:675 length:186 start_codon:yes stop_codon:yes gene_type:complete